MNNRWKKKLLFINSLIVSILCLAVLSQIHFSTTKLAAKSSMSLKTVEKSINEKHMFHLEITDERSAQELKEPSESDSLNYFHEDMTDKEEAAVKRALKLSIPEGVRFDEESQSELMRETENSSVNQSEFLWDEDSRQLLISMDVTQAKLLLTLFAESEGEYTLELSDETNSVEAKQLQVFVDKEPSETAELSVVEPLDEIIEPTNDGDIASEELGVRDVSSWADFTAALTDSSVSVIRLQSDIARTATTAATAAGTITRSLTIEGNGYTINFNTDNGGFTLGSISEKQTLTLKNVSLVKAGGTAIFNSTAANSNNWELALETINSGSGNVSGLVNAPNATIRFTGGISTYNLSSTNTIFIAKEFYVANQSQVDITTNGRIHESRVDYSVFKVTEGSTLNWQSAVIAVFIINLEPVIEISGVGTEVNVSSTIASGQDNATFQIGNSTSATNAQRAPHARAVLNVLDEAVFRVSGTRGTALAMKSHEGTFNVDNNALFELNAGGGNSYFGALRFMWVGDYTFNITNNSKISVVKTAGVAPAVRMYGDNNRINVLSGSSLEIYNAGNGNPSNSASAGNNHGIQYESGSNQLFNLEGYGSKVQITADFGPAIRMSGTGSILAGEGTTFYASGRTSTSSGGIFDTGVSTITLDAPEYFDFRNTRPGGGNIYNVSSASTLTAENTHFAVWRNGTNLDTDPFRSWNTLDFTLTGSNFGSIRSTSHADEFNSSANSLGSSGLTAYSRVSANNAAAIVDDLRVPTTADKNIFGHVSVPEGNIGQRSAWQDEVTVEVELLRADGTVDTFLTKTIGLDDENPGISIYGEEVIGGVFQIQLNDYLSEGDQVRVLSTYRGEQPRGVESRPQDIQVDKVVTFPIVPPTPAQFVTEVVKSTDSVIKGYSENREVEITATHEGQPIDTSGVLVDDSGNFEIPISDLVLKDFDEIQVFLRDKAGSAAAAGVINPPSTNNSIGNINPAEEMVFHDKTFVKAATLAVEEIKAAILTVEFVNEADQLLQGYTLTIDTQVGDYLDLTKEASIVEQLANLQAAGYEIYQRPENETNLAIGSTAVTVQYRVQGVLSLTSVPSSLDFGKLTYNATTKRVEDPNFDERLVITDTRAATSDGWTITAALVSPMKNADGQELVNALRYVYDGQETILNSSAQNVYVNNGSTGIFDISDSWGTTAGTDGVKLQIGASDIVHTGNYIGRITWTVMAGQP